MYGRHWHLLSWVNVASFDWEYALLIIKIRLHYEKRYNENKGPMGTLLTREPVPTN